MTNNNSRKCIVTNQIKPKEQLIRIVKTKQGTYEVNSDAKGRGAYVSKDASLINELAKKRLLNRSFKTSVPQEVYDKLIEILQGGN